MRNSDIYKLSEYLNIVNTLIERYSFASVFKVMITSLLLYHQSWSGMELKKAKLDFFKGFFGNFHSVLLTNYDDFVAISTALLIDEKSGKITVSGDIIQKFCQLDNVRATRCGEYLEKKNISKVLNDISHMSVAAFAQEVIQNV